MSILFILFGNFYVSGINLLLELLIATIIMTTNCKHYFINK